MKLKIKLLIMMMINILLLKNSVSLVSKFMSENFAARLAQTNLVSNNDIADFVKKSDFDDKLKNLNKKVTSNKARHIEVKTKLDDL